MRDITPEIAELAGIFAADGSMQKEHICFWGNITEDKEYYDYTLKKLFKQAFDIDVNPHEKKSNSVYGFYVCQKNIISYFHNVLGFPFGSKTYTVEIPTTILQSHNPKIWAAFVRGFVDGDGGLTFLKRTNGYSEFKLKHNTYPRIFVSCVSKNMILQLSYLLLRLGIKHVVNKSSSARPNEHEYYRIQVNGPERIARYCRIVGFSNPAQISRLNIYKAQGHVPAYSTHSERKKLINNS